MEERFVIVKTKIEGENQFFAVPFEELTAFELGNDLQEPYIGRDIDISINATYPIHVKVFAVQNTSNGFRILRRAGYCGLDEMINNFSTGID